MRTKDAAHEKHNKKYARNVGTIQGIVAGKKLQLGYLDAHNLASTDR